MKNRKYIYTNLLSRRKFFLKIYLKNMIIMRQHCISKNFNKSLSFINKIIIKLYKINKLRILSITAYVNRSNTIKKAKIDQILDTNNTLYILLYKISLINFKCMVKIFKVLYHNYHIFGVNFKSKFSPYIYFKYKMTGGNIIQKAYSKSSMQLDSYFTSDIKTHYGLVD